MARIVQSPDDNTIVLPSWIMERLSLKDGDEITPVIEGKTLYLESGVRSLALDRFLALRGFYQKDDDFEQAIQELEESWQQWTSPKSV